MAVTKRVNVATTFEKPIILKARNKKTKRLEKCLKSNNYPILNYWKRKCAPLAIYSECSNILRSRSLPACPPAPLQQKRDLPCVDTFLCLLKSSKSGASRALGWVCSACPSVLHPSLILQSKHISDNTYFVTTYAQCPRANRTASGKTSNTHKPQNKKAAQQISTYKHGYTPSSDFRIPSLTLTFLKRRAYCLSPVSVVSL